MKKKFLLLISLVCLLLTLLPACEINTEGSIKSITHPYINEYDCSEARLGEEDILEKYDFIKVSILDDKELEVKYKLKNEETRSFKCDYKMNEETRELTAEKGFFGMKIGEKVKIENGQFEVLRKIGDKTLYMKFQTK